MSCGWLKLRCQVDFMSTATISTGCLQWRDKLGLNMITNEVQSHGMYKIYCDVMGISLGWLMLQWPQNHDQVICSLGGNSCNIQVDRIGTRSWFQVTIGTRFGKSSRDRCCGIVRLWRTMTPHEPRAMNRSLDTFVLVYLVPKDIVSAWAISTWPGIFEYKSRLPHPAISCWLHDAQVSHRRV